MQPADDNVPERVRNYIRQNLESLVANVNRAFSDTEYLATLAESISRNSVGNQVPSWYEELLRDEALSVTSPKSLGSVVEKVVAAIVELELVPDIDGVEPFEVRLNPAAGVDMPDIELGVKSPSTNYCTSEPFYSIWERLSGNLDDCIVLVTNFQEVKNDIPYTLRIINSEYLEGIELADTVLTEHARRARTHLGIDELIFWNFCRFLCLANKTTAQADKALIRMFSNLFDSLDQVSEGNDPIETAPNLEECEIELDEWMGTYAPPIFRDIQPTEIQRQRIENGPLRGRISISFALQWRYAFRSTFN